MKLRRAAGFTLLEILMTLAISAPVMTAIFEMIFASMAARARAGDLDIAINLARHKMVEIESQPILKTGTTRGEFESQRGYFFETEVKEVEVDLLNGGAEVGADTPEKEGEPGANPISEGLSGTNEKLAESIKEKGFSLESITGGIIPMTKVMVSVIWTQSGREKRYELKTYKPPRL